MAKKTSDSNKVYTYRNGKKVYLNKESDQFVTRALPEELAKRGITEGLEQVSSASSRVTISPETLDPTMEALRNDTVTHHAYNLAENNAAFLLTDRIIVTFKEPALDDVLTAFMTKYALILQERYSSKEFLFQLTDQTGMNPVKLVVSITENEAGLIQYCEHDLNQRMTIKLNLPVDNKYIQQWHLHTNLINSSFDHRSSSNCENAWNLLNNFGSHDVVIGITDDGCRLDHPDFNSPNKFAQWGYMQGTKLINRDSISANPTNMYKSGSDHGTACCGVASADVDASLTVGAAAGCRLLPIKWESSGPSLFISDGKMITVLDFVADKIDILSNSWGSSPEFSFISNVTTRIRNMASNGGRRGKGIVFLWAAGNENCPIKHSGNIDIPFDNGYDIYPTWRGVNTARNFNHNLVEIPGVMHIAALASNAQRSHYSNYGTGISASAPTSNSHAYWRMAVTGLGITTTSGVSPLWDAQFGGTSSATPLVAGVAALIISANPNLTGLEVISILQKTASRDLNMTTYSRTSVTPFDPDTSWDVSPIAPFDNGQFNDIGHPDGTWSGWFGFGKIDAEAAVNEALRLLGGSGSNTNYISKSLSPSLVIPDNNATGVISVINIAESGTISSLEIDLDIQHTYIGDLAIEILSPTGTSVILHARNGASANNIKKKFNPQNTPILSTILGENANGDWTLHLADNAPVDTGILNKWTLNLGIGINQVETLEDAPGITIPDNNPTGIERSLNVSSGGILKRLEVGLDITHTYIGDLIVNLSSPNGSTINLHGRTGGSADNIIRIYNESNYTVLQSIRGEQIQGNWKLNVSDVVGQDIGKLNRWFLKLETE